MEPHFKSVAQADKHAVLQPPLSEMRQALLIAMIVLYFYCISIWISIDGPFKNWVLTGLRPIMVAVGFIQAWNLFSPEVRNVNLHMNAVITFADGSTKNYEFPRMEKLDLLGRFQKEKMRKLFVDNLSWPGFEEFLPAVARFIARANLNPANQPVMVTISRNWTRMPPPDLKNWVPRDQWRLHGYHMVNLIYMVKEQDLQ